MPEEKLTTMDAEPIPAKPRTTKVQMKEPAPEHPWEKRFIRASNDLTIYLVLDGQRRRFDKWIELSRHFGDVPQYHEAYQAGVAVIPLAEVEAIPEGPSYCSEFPMPPAPEPQDE